MQWHVTVTFLKVGWASNMISLLSSPLTPIEYIIAVVLWAMTLIGVAVGIMTIVAYGLFSFGILEMGPALIPFIVLLLMFALAMALVVIGLVLRIGTGANILAWGLTGIMQPLCGVFFPIAILPGWAQSVAFLLPPSHIFEGMRAVLSDGSISWGNLGITLLLDIVYLLLAARFVRRMFATFRARGFITRYAS